MSFPLYLIICGIDTLTLCLEAESVRVKNILVKLENQTGVVDTVNISPAICAYEGRLAGTEPSMNILLSFNPTKISSENAILFAQLFVNELAREYKQHVVPAYRLGCDGIVGKN